MLRYIKSVDAFMARVKNLLILIKKPDICLQPYLFHFRLLQFRTGPYMSDNDDYPIYDLKLLMGHYLNIPVHA